MNLRKTTLLGGIAMLLFAYPVMAGNLPGYPDPERDTIILEFGNNSRIVIYIDKKEDLETLNRYDINRILYDLYRQVGELNDTVRVIEIRDASGEKYLKEEGVISHFEYRSWEDDDDSPEGDDDDDRYRYQPRSRLDFILDVGLNNYLENGSFPAGNQPYSLRPLGSWYWNLGPTYRSHLFGPVFIDLGLSAALNVYRFDNPRSRLIADDNGVQFVLDNNNYNYKKSKLSTWHLQAKVVPMLAFGSNQRRSWRLWNNIDKGFRIGAGMYGGYRLWSRTKYVYDDNGNKQKDKATANHLLANVRYGIRGQIGFKGIDLFVEYDLNNMFQQNQGAPALTRLQFGLTL